MPGINPGRRCNCQGTMKGGIFDLNVRNICPSTNRRFQGAKNTLSEKYYLKIFHIPAEKM